MRTLIAIMFDLMLLGLLTTVTAIGYSELHEDMTPEELKQVFDADPGRVPKYEIAQINVRKQESRSRSPYTAISLNAFGRRVDLRLKPTDGVLAGINTPVYVVKTDSTSEIGYSVSINEDVMSIVGSLLENREKKASMILKETPSGRTSIYGNVESEGWIVKPVPPRFDEELITSKYRRSANDVDAFEKLAVENSSSGYHVIFESSGPSRETFSLAPEFIDQTTFPVIEDVPFNSEARQEPHIVPSIVYPQLFVIADHETFKRHGNLSNLVEYSLPFWNGVGLRYRTLKHPKVRLNIAGIMVAADENAFSFISRNRVSKDTLNIAGTLTSLGRHMLAAERYFPSDSYDIAVAMSPYTMCAPRELSICKPGALGVAFNSGACAVIDSNLTKSLASVAVIRDRGVFDGIHTAAHELGHLFGGRHDGLENPLCSAAAGHIMSSTPKLTKYSADWSQCTLKDFDKYFKSPRSKCLFNKPNVKSSIPRVLPGRLLTMDEQCQKFAGTKSCRPASTDNNICTYTSCISKIRTNSCVYFGYAPPDGTICGTDKICFRGKCLYETETKFILPSYWPA